MRGSLKGKVGHLIAIEVPAHKDSLTVKSSKHSTEHAVVLSGECPFLGTERLPVGDCCYCWLGHHESLDCLQTVWDTELSCFCTEMSVLQ